MKQSNNVSRGNIVITDNAEGMEEWFRHKALNCKILAYFSIKPLTCRNNPGNNVQIQTLPVGLVFFDTMPHLNA